MGELVRRRIRVTGTVQGVGFRPFVWREATMRGLSGWVGNDAAGVLIEVEGPDDRVGGLLCALDAPPPLATISGVSTTVVPLTGVRGFAIRSSDVAGRRTALIPPDTGVCTDCLTELRDPADRRIGYPFINCTACGPRYSIALRVPYDRAQTTMRSFPMCTVCQAEYDDPRDRRFHAEATCCPECGPVLRLVPPGSSEDPIAGAADALRAGAVVAVKGIGGFHLAVDASNPTAVQALRDRKHREDRPFALMVRDAAAAGDLCDVGPEELALLASPPRPIVLLRRRSGAPVAGSVAPGSPWLGLMLPYTPLHVLLLDAVGGPLVLTSGNLSDEPIAFEDDDAWERLQGIADAFLLHDRAIRTRVDDSVVAVVDGRPLPVRRSRGHAPSPIELRHADGPQVLACGAALKSTFCLTRDGLAFVSQHVGDLDQPAALQSYVDAIAHLSALLDVEPSVVAHDLHPDYASTQYAEDLPGVALVPVQHHHAHIASCLADNGEAGPVIGVAFDGVGLGTDGTAWGGEFLVADLRGFTRAAHLRPVLMPGGDAATRQPWRMAAAHLDAAGVRSDGLAVAQRQGRRWEQVLAAARAGVNAPLTSSAGRLFDAVSALLGVRDVVTYEGQAAIELEHLADPLERGTYFVPVVDGVVEVSELVRRIAEDLARGVPAAVLAARFHNALADVVVEVCGQIRDVHDLSTVALSGGVFQNRLLVVRCLDRLRGSDFRVLTHSRVPPNDGGISLGQAAVACAQLSQT